MDVTFLTLKDVNGPRPTYIYNKRTKLVMYNNVAVTVPKGTLTDLASIPRVVSAISSPHDAWALMPSLIHDVAYELQGGKRKYKQYNNTLNVTKLQVDYYYLMQLLASANNYKSTTRLRYIVQSFLRFFALTLHPASYSAWSNCTPNTIPK